jgi:hypothetical protein
MLIVPPACLRQDAQVDQVDRPAYRDRLARQELTRAAPQQNLAIAGALGARC